ncbi:hypothetical protein L1987_22092 [Smallanthus sonchifolius]|uniref:Uncharacterized protein n=1 Tax=Smallanthus sonchifolius TaxID=185202 RepID=A0ACB9IEI8_9ASTR|nr:hypothetical protein L1987_22092 [Smallanthus sonchifolius]
MRSVQVAEIIGIHIKPKKNQIAPSLFKSTMAIAGLQRLSRNPTFSLYSRAIISRSSATTSSSAKVSDRIVKLIAYDFDGQKREIVGLSGQTLLKALTNHNLIDPASHRLEDIDACSAECEVNIAEEWLEKLPPATYDEQYVLKRNARHRILNKHSRLGCQVVLTQEMQGMVVAVPEPKPWDTPFNQVVSDFNGQRPAEH